MLNFFLPNIIKIDKKGEKVFCSEEIVMCLQKTQPSLHDDLKAYATNPYDLFNHLMNNVKKLKETKEPKSSQFMQ